MDLRWPLVGRERELERVRSVLCDGGRGVLLAGPAGAGKTRLAGECLAVAVVAGYVGLRLSATRAAASLPFGAFAEFVPDVAAGTVRAQVMRQVAAAVLARGEGSPVALFIDDAHLLDESSAAVAHLLAAGSEPVFLIATVRSGEPASDAVVALWKDGLAERLELEPLDGAKTAELVALALGGPVDGAAARALWRRSTGNVLFLREIVLGALQSGSLHDDRGVWRLRRALPMSARLAEIVEARFGQVEDATRDALAVVALGEPLGAEVLERVDDAFDLEDLVRRGLVVVERDGRRLAVRLAHPLYGEVVCARMSPVRARSLAGVLAVELEATGVRRREDPLRVATLHLDAGGSPTPGLMLRAATIARQRFDLALAGRLAQSAFDAGAGFDAGLLLGQLLWWQDRAHEADRQLSALAAQAADDEQRAALATVRMDVLAFGLNRIDDAIGVADAAEATMHDVGARDRVAAYRGRSLGWSGKTAAAIAAVEPLLERATGPTLISACMAAATNKAFAGRTSEALQATERGHAEQLAWTGPALPFSTAFHRWIRVSALTFAGRLAEAEPIAVAEYDNAIAAGSLEGRAYFSMSLAHMTLSQGQLAAAVRYASDSVAEFRRVGSWPLFMRMSLIFLARAHGERGDHHASRAALADIDALQVPTEYMLGPELLRARAWAAVAEGSPSDGLVELEQAIAMAAAAGAHALELGALHDLARLGQAADVARRLRELVDLVEGPLAPACALHAEALVAQDAPALAAASLAFEELGAILLAAEAAADGAVALRRALDPRRATAAEQRAGALHARTGGARTPALTAAAAARAALTPRELEIARLAARGLSNKNIAERLFLSHRTVENKLHACYAKLGADGRRDLARALAQY
ncbi:MAG: hypothetical protein QOJ35_4107 [Solirubrobacteraceae bacterium]|nr:hypothetical protein [Solirubrobacteraceae bacterium]